MQKTKNPKISIIAAVAKNGVIGVNNSLPWYLPDDLKHFKDKTLGKAVLMGRKTFESLGGSLKERQNIILTRDPNYQAPNCEVVSSIEEAKKIAKSDEIMIIGGASLYAQTLPIANKMYLTLIDKEYEGDAFFPNYDKNDWVEVERDERDGFSFVTLERR